MSQKLVYLFHRECVNLIQNFLTSPTNLHLNKLLVYDRRYRHRRHLTLKSEIGYQFVIRSLFFLSLHCHYHYQSPSNGLPLKDSKFFFTMQLLIEYIKNKGSSSNVFCKIVVSVKEEFVKFSGRQLCCVGISFLIKLQTLGRDYSNGVFHQILRSFLRLFYATPFSCCF